MVTRLLHDCRIVPRRSLVSSGPTSCCPQRFFTSEHIRARVLFAHDALRTCPSAFVGERAVWRVGFPLSARWREPGAQVRQPGWAAAPAALRAAPEDLGLYAWPVGRQPGELCLPSGTLVQRHGRCCLHCPAASVRAARACVRTARGPGGLLIQSVSPGAPRGAARLAPHLPVCPGASGPPWGLCSDLAWPLTWGPVTVRTSDLSPDTFSPGAPFVALWM